MKKVYFLGIGGIGMSALARYYQSVGYEVYGSDSSKGEVTELLEKEGMHIHYGVDSNNIPTDAEKVIYTIAVSADNEELLEAKSRNIPVLTYPEALGEMCNSKKVIAVCGTHGKTTTTALTYYALKNAGVDVSMIIGSLIEHEGKKTNYVHGNSEWIIIEACEYRRSFLNYLPDYILVTNIDADHLDYFKDINDIKHAFQEFVGKIKDKGGLVVHKEEDFLDHPNKSICEDVLPLNEIELTVPGEHNRKNAQLVVALAKLIGLDQGKILEGLKNFKGTWRRQEYKGEFFGAPFYDDYAHHPTEVKATISALKEKYPDKKLLIIFQPHLFSRTKLLFSDFVSSLKDGDEVWLTPIYPAREAFDSSISSKMIVDELVNFGKISKIVELDEIKKNLESKDLLNTVVATLSAGSLHYLYQELK